MERLSSILQANVGTPLRARAILAGRYPARIPSVVERALVHLDRGDGRALCRASLQLMQDDGYDPGPATCERCVNRAKRRGLMGVDVPK